MTVNNKDVNIDFQKMSHRKMKKSDHKLHFDHKLNRFFDHKLDTPLYRMLFNSKRTISKADNFGKTRNIRERKFAETD